MSDDMLTQEEIEALLRGESLDHRMPQDNVSKEENVQEYNINDYLTEMEQDTLGEIGNISFGSSATALSSLLGQKVEITTPVVSLIHQSKVEKEFPFPYVAIQVEYTAGLSGLNLLVIKQSDAAIIADLMLGGDGLNPEKELNDIHLSAVQEAMNQMMGSAATSMSTIFNKKVDISPPSIYLLDFKNNEGRENLPDEDILVKVSFRLRIGELVDSSIMQLLPIRFSEKLVKALLSGDETTEENVEQTGMNLESPTEMNMSQNSTYDSAPVSEAKTQKVIHSQPERTPMEEQAATTYQEPPSVRTLQPKVQPANVREAQFASFEMPAMSESEVRNLNMLLDIPLQVTVELGRTKHTVKEILQLASGSIIELDRLAGEPVDILVNNRLIAKGEVVVIDENFGVRISDIVSQKERINNLR